VSRRDGGSGRDGGPESPPNPPASRPSWDFGYAPVSRAAGPPEAARELVVATPAALPGEHLASVLGEGARAETLVERAPIFWTRVVLERPADAEAIAARLRAGGVVFRYVASAERPSLALGPVLDLAGAAPARPGAWTARRREPGARPDAEAPGMWFLRRGEGGVAVDPDRSGDGAGTRLAVIDDDARDAHLLDLDAEVLVGLEAAPRHSLHGMVVVAWATGARGFAGVAPGASRRLYLIPKPGRGVVALPLALVRAVDDGADVVVCATYVEGATSPMLDDALAFASRLGRRGRGAAVVLPTGREASSPEGSTHASFSLGLGEPASDPRVHCVAPGARGEGWFLWRDRRGQKRPFANRGPTVRWLAPGDDIASPLAPARLFHAESSGAAAVAAGVILLVLAQNPSLRLPELFAVLRATAAPVAPGAPVEALADPADGLPGGRDRDGHDAKHGYGLLDAGRACLAAADPVCASLLAMGEDAAARAFADARREGPAVARAYSRRLGRFAVRALLADPDLGHALRALLRHLRLVANRDERALAHGDGALARQLRLLVRGLSTRRPRPPPRILAELAALDDRLGRPPTASGAPGLERALLAAAARAFSLIPPPIQA
jgi:hypothetical protein